MAWVCPLHLTPVFMCLASKLCSNCAQHCCVFRRMDALQILALIAPLVCMQDSKGMTKLLLIVPESQAFAFQSIKTYSLPVSGLWERLSSKADQGCLSAATIHYASWWSFLHLVCPDASTAATSMSLATSCSRGCKCTSRIHFYFA